MKFYRFEYQYVDGERREPFRLIVELPDAAAGSFNASGELDQFMHRDKAANCRFAGKVQLRDLPRDMEKRVSVKVPVLGGMARIWILNGAVPNLFTIGFHPVSVRKTRTLLVEIVHGDPTRDEVEDFAYEALMANGLANYPGHITFSPPIKDYDVAVPFERPYPGNGMNAWLIPDKPFDPDKLVSSRELYPVRT